MVTPESGTEAHRKETEPLRRFKGGTKNGGGGGCGERECRVLEVRGGGVWGMAYGLMIAVEPAWW